MSALTDNHVSIEPVARASRSVEEVLPPSSPRVVAMATPFSEERIDRYVRQGSTLSEIVVGLGVPVKFHDSVRLWVNGVEIANSAWAFTKPKPNTVINVKVVPRGGGGGGGKNPLMIVGMLVIMVVAWYAAPAIAGSILSTTAAAAAEAGGMAAFTFAATKAAVGLAITMIGSAILNAVVPMSTANARSGTSQQWSSPTDTPSMSITGSQNKANPFGPISKVFGRRRIYPAVAATPMTEIIGNNQYLRMVFSCGLGPVQIEDIRIGTAPITAYSEVEYEVRQGYDSDESLRLYTKSIHEDSSAYVLSNSIEWSSRNMLTASDKISLTMEFPNGLTAGGTQTSVEFTVETCLIGTSDWKAVKWPSQNSTTPGDGRWVVSGNTHSATSFSIQWDNATKDIYRVRIQRVTSESSEQVGSPSRSRWSALRGFVIGQEGWTDTPDMGIDVQHEIQWYQQDSRMDADELSIDVTFPRGLCLFNNSGGRDNHTVELKVQYAEVGTENWLDPHWIYQSDDTVAQSMFPADGRFVLTDNSAQTVRRGGRWKVPTKGQYTVRVQRITANTNDSKYLEQCNWTTIRTVVAEYPIKQKGLGLIAVRIKASEQLNGVIQELNCVVTSILPVWDGANWSHQVTRNPAWAYCEVLRGKGNRRPVSDARIDLVAIKNWADACDTLSPQGEANMWNYDAVHDTKSTVFETLKLITSSCRAAFCMREGKFSVVRDILQTSPKQHFTPRNSWGFRSTKTFVIQPHGLRVRWVNPDLDWQEDELIVYTNGYSAANAELFEQVDMFGCTSHQQAWREARFHMAASVLRPEVYEIMVDVESLICSPGDMILVSHDVPLWGSSWARIKRVALDENGGCTGVELDDHTVMETGKTYSLRIRLHTGDSIVAPVRTVPGESNSVQFTTVLVDADVPRSGDLVMFGEVGRETNECIVKSVTRDKDLSARITFLDASKEIHSWYSGDIPAYDANITKPVNHVVDPPPVPTFFSMVSDEAVLERMPNGQLKSRILINFDSQASSTVMTERFDVQWRQVGEVNWSHQASSMLGVRSVYVSPVNDSVTYELRARGISHTGVPSGWSDIVTHTVIGQTTPPGNVTNFQALRKVNGVQLSWDAVPAIDILGYEVWREEWGQGKDVTVGTRITTEFRGQTLFVALSDALDHTFYIKAMDDGRRYSLEYASVAASVAVPDDVTNFTALSDDARVQFFWTPVYGDNIQYEIREGATFGTSQFVGTYSGDRANILFPHGGDRTFWIRAVSPLGRFSEVPTFYSTSIAQSSPRNLVVEFSQNDPTTNYPTPGPAGGWVGPKKGLEIASPANDLAFVMDNQTMKGEHFFKIGLPGRFRGRTWNDSVYYTITNSMTWDDATFSWTASAAGIPWSSVSEDAFGGLQIKISTDLETLPADVVEGFQLDGSSDGLLGATPAEFSGVVYEDSRHRSGARLGDLSRVSWNVTIPSEFSTSFLLRFPDGLTDSCGILSLSAAGNVKLQIGYDARTGEIYLTDPSRVRNSILLPVAVDDIVRLAVAQTATQRFLFGWSYSSNSVVSSVVSAAPLGSFTKLALYPIL